MKIKNSMLGKYDRKQGKQVFGKRTFSTWERKQIRNTCSFIFIFFFHLILNLNCFFFLLELKKNRFSWDPTIIYGKEALPFTLMENQPKIKQTSQERKKKITHNANKVSRTIFQIEKKGMKLLEKNKRWRCESQK